VAVVKQDADRWLMEQYLSSQDMLYGYVVSILPSWADAEEVFQETSLILWEKREGYDHTRSFVAWSYGIARNVALDFIRKNRASRATLSPELITKVEEVRLRVGDVLQRQGEALQHCLERLSENQRSFVMNCYGTDVPMVQVAGRLGLSENAVYLRLSRLRKTLLDCIRRTLRQEENV
jgi:RNA polymerase sigma-70 factor, ECF subfamily